MRRSILWWCHVRLSPAAVSWNLSLSDVTAVSCPSCGNLYVMQRTTSMSFKLVNVQHRHCIFTIYDYLWDFFQRPFPPTSLFLAVNSVVSRIFFKQNKSLLSLQALSWCFTLSAEIWSGIHTSTASFLKVLTVIIVSSAISVTSTILTFVMLPYRPPQWNWKLYRPLL